MLIITFTNFIVAFVISVIKISWQIHMSWLNAKN